MKLYLFVFLFLTSLSITAQQLKKNGDNYEIKYKKKSKYPMGPELGSKIPIKENLKDIYGNTISISELESGITVLNFWFIGCKMCKMEEPNLKELSSYFSDNSNIKFVSICRSSSDLIHSYYAKYGEFGYKTVSVERPYVIDNFNIVGFPTQLYYVNGILKDKTSGAMNEEYHLEWMKNYLEKQIKENTL
ncbi:TlpA family protein disulfide reductase [Flammeovirga agarivorans]|uniref:Redoxin domain-containing protein n=1 Tax=Flammeovirga agarivorans TaxID=2726742 RepID=A0A7X8SHE5_9BACT|nr:redoxin domain-containing protein [Flammeovirga agarivorans]NLR90265.1 redoxin domain-containing protein [Flammeovirga agarivorans]